MSNFTVDAQSSPVQQSNPSIQIVPNPASDHAVIYFPLLAGEETLTISDERGGLLFSQSVPAGADLLVVSTTPFADGRYMVEIGALRAALVILKNQ